MPSPTGWVNPLGLASAKAQCPSGARPDFYVGPSGPESTLPATGYRYMRYMNDDGSVNKYAEMTMESKSAPATYVGFERYQTGSSARDAFQIKGREFGHDESGAGSWSDARLRGQFDTLQLYESGVPQARVPYWKGDTEKEKLELFAKAYPQYGSGGAVQLHLDGRMLDFDKVDILPEN